MTDRNAMPNNTAEIGFPKNIEKLPSDIFNDCLTAFPIKGESTMANASGLLQNQVISDKKALFEVLTI